MKKLLIVVFGVIILTNAFSQTNNNTDSLMLIISQKVNNLPRTLDSGIKGQEFQGEYTMKWKKRQNVIILKDKRFFIKSNSKTPDTYKDIIYLKDLHPDGICLKYSDDSSSVFLQIFTANNKYLTISKSYVNGFCRSKNYYDRTYMGSWNTKDNISKLIDIQQLLKKCIESETDWGIESAPDVFCLIQPELTFKKKNITVIPFDNPLILNSSIEKPALFSDSKNEQENREIIKSYVLHKLRDKGMNYQGNTIGTIIIDKSGNVTDFKFVRNKADSMGDEIKKILLSMPQWTPANLDKENVVVGQTIVI